MKHHKANITVNLALLAGAAIALSGCNQTKKTAPPVQAKLEGSQARTYKNCIYDALTKNTAAGISTKFSDDGGKGFVTTVMTDGQPVATITLASDGSVARLDNIGEVKSPLKPLNQTQLTDTVNAAPGCYKKAKLG